MSEVEIFHEDKIRLESDHYFSYINNLRINPEYLNAERIELFVRAVNEAFELEVAEIYSINFINGRRKTWYQRKSANRLPSDTDQMPLYQLKTVVSPYDKQGRLRSLELEKMNTMKFENFLGGLKIPQEQWVDFFNTYFEPYPGLKVRRVELVMKSLNSQIKYRKKQSGGRQWGLVHENAYGSPIEEELGEALKKSPSIKALNVTILQQEEIYSDGILLTRPDFLIPEADLIIYCDGFQYHYTKESVIKDRTQDRKLQLMGYHVLRYTGSEIKGRLYDCVQEVGHFVQRFKKKST
jgi:hypothetical protein